MKTYTVFDSLQEMNEIIAKMRSLNESFGGHMTTSEMEAFIASATDLLIPLSRKGDCAEATHNQRSAYTNEFDLMALAITGARKIIEERRLS